MAYRRAPLPYAIHRARLVAVRSVRWSATVPPDQPPLRADLGLHDNRPSAR